MYLIADANGNALNYNPDTYDTIAFSPAEIRRICGFLEAGVQRAQGQRRNAVFDRGGPDFR